MGNRIAQGQDIVHRVTLNDSEGNPLDTQVDIADYCAFVFVMNGAKKQSPLATFRKTPSEGEFQIDFSGTTNEELSISITSSLINKISASGILCVEYWTKSITTEFPSGKSDPVKNSDDEQLFFILGEVNIMSNPNPFS